MSTFEIKTGDLEPAMVVVCNSGGGPLDISGAVAVRVIVAAPDATAPIIDAAAENLDDGTVETRGQVKYEWQSGDTDVSGIFRVEVEVEWSAGRTQTFPGSGYQKLKISPDLN